MTCGVKENESWKTAVQLPKTCTNEVHLRLSGISLKVVITNSNPFKADRSPSILSECICGLDFRERSSNSAYLFSKLFFYSTKQVLSEISD
ncbi:hypothetical protein C5167_000451 [Papaver somniferum]|uniref:Uncharacterized protein n=1 Tax=Papaver somniferum TaxID=3469 RepID=A0A4Y7KSQ3_PAPSO|nr:hypothetical protein C5167_000451 [Papaver somniferum]